METTKYIEIEGDIIKGDTVCYIDTQSKKVGKNYTTVKVPLYGIWDGEKVECTDKERTTVRKKEWLTRVSIK